MTAEGPARTAETPRMLLVFVGVGADVPVRPVHVAAVLSSLEEIFLVTLLRDAPRPTTSGANGCWDYDASRSTWGLTDCGSNRGSVLLALPWHVYTLPFSAFAYGFAHVFGAPTHRRAALRPRARGLLEQPPRGRQPQARVDAVAGVAGVQARGGGAHRAVPPEPRSTSS